MSNIVDTVEDRIQNADLTAINNIIAPKIELGERREHVGINTSFENASENNDTLGASNVIDETRHNIPIDVS